MPATFAHPFDARMATQQKADDLAARVAAVDATAGGAIGLGRAVHDNAVLTDGVVQTPLDEARRVVETVLKSRGEGRSMINTVLRSVFAVLKKG